MILNFLTVLAAVTTIANCFVPTKTTYSRSSSMLMADEESYYTDGTPQNNFTPGRRSFLSLISAIGPMLSIDSAFADDSGDEESFASIAARASKLSSSVGEMAPSAVTRSTDGKTAYDFSLPVKGESVNFKDIIQQEFDDEGRARVKAILVVNMKEDDPISRTNIPEFISLAAKYGRTGEFAVVLSPSDQGYYEPDTSQLIRLKLASEYGYGINPATIVTDKVIYLGTGATPFWRWLQKNCRTPAGLGRVEANYEKFLVDGRTGVPLRRYPRKYKPLDMKNDIEALVNGRQLPPAGANYLEQWRAAAVSAEADTYRFQKGLNYYDQ